MSIPDITKIQHRIVLWAVLGILLTGLLVGLSAGLPFYQHARENAEQGVALSARAQADAIGHLLTKFADIARQFTSRSEIRDRLVLYTRNELSLDALIAFSEPRLRDALRQAPEVAGLTRLGPGHRPLLELGHAIPETHWPIPDAASRAVRLGALASLNGEPVLLVGAPIFTREGERVGTDVVAFRLDALTGLLEDQSRYRVPARQYLGETTRNTLLGIDPATGHTTLIRPDGRLAETLERARDGAGGMLGDQPQVFFHTPVGIGDWTYLIELDSDELYSLAAHELTLPLLTVLGMVLLGLFATVRAIHPLVARVVDQSARLTQITEEQRALLELAQGFIYRRDDRGAFTYVSPAVESATGYAPAEFALLPELLDQLPAVGGESGERHRLLDIRHKEGHPITLEIMERPALAIGEWRGRGRAPHRGATGVARDVTGRVAAELALRENEERLRTLINATPDIICFKDGEGRWLEANESDLRLFALEHVDYHGRTDSELADHTDPLYRDAFLACEESDEIAWRRGGVSRGEEAIPTVDGDERVFDVIKVPVYTEIGSRKGLVVLGRDVTERRRVEQALAKSAAEWTHAMDFFEDGVCLLDADARVARANKAFFRMLGMTPEEMLGRDLCEVIVPSGDLDACATCKALHAKQDAFITQEADHAYNPTGRPLEVMIKMIRDASGAIIGALLAIHDLTRTRQTEEQLRLAASVFQGSQEAIVITDAEHRIMEVNQAFERMTGFPREEVENRTLHDLMAQLRYDALHFEQLCDTLKKVGNWQGEVWYRRHEGDEFPAWQNISAVKNEQGRIIRFISIFSDISERKQSEERINHLAHYDLLTDLPNRVLLHDRLNDALERARRSHNKLAVLFIDLDRFKNVNDSLGHSIGDRLLQAIAHRLIATVREQDTVARLGGDEFLVILESLAAPQHAGVVARKILNGLIEPIHIDEHEIFIGGSIGISLFPSDGETPELLIKNADTAMYRAKDQGRNTYQYYTPELSRLSRERFELESGLRRALERGELRLYYQPQATFDDGATFGAEALIRWQSPDKGLVPPDRFIPLAEDTGLIHAIGRWVLLTACEQARRWEIDGRPLRIAVNLSGVQIVHGNVVQTVREVLRETHLDPSLLELEITEGFVLSHAEQGIRTLRELKALGVSLAIDDFGTGYSSLSYLKRLPVDRLKIDRSFVNGIPDDRDDMAIVQTVIAMARNLGLEVIAEGVETAEQKTFLAASACDAWQGYLLSRPLPLDEFENLLSSQMLMPGTGPNPIRVQD
ncbi:MAG: EAL domain-containing protein [Chromatiales bacterium]|nr:EAL domain-containing protein [Chromatiales bacterium]